MECIEARALKSSFLKTHYQVINHEDRSFSTGINNGTVTEDDFAVEELLNLDFTEKEAQEECIFLQQSEEEEDDETKTFRNGNSENSDAVSGEFRDVSAGELSLPADDLENQNLENLEWLSQFVDDSTSGVSLLHPTVNFTAKNGGYFVTPTPKTNRPAVQKNRQHPCLQLQVPRKSRSKKSKLNGRPWPLKPPPLTAVDYSTSSFSSHGSSSTFFPFMFTNPVQDWFSSVEKPPAKKQKRKPAIESGSVSIRRCTHCQVQKTPQWRAGPLGPKTLCNACGVRFKSGRLYPEYRPACSPTFLQEVHSNSHRKVLEMRRRKEDVAEPGSMVTVHDLFGKPVGGRIVIGV